MSKTEESIKTIYPTLKSSFNITNDLALPRIEKIVISVGLNASIIKDKKRLDFINKRLTSILGQKIAPRTARKSIATFKVRKGEKIGLVATLRGKQMYAFLDKLIHIAIPRMRDFHGILSKSIDEMGNISIGIPEHTIFPESQEDDLRDAFSFAITIVTTAKNKELVYEFLRGAGFPLKEK